MTAFDDVDILRMRVAQSTSASIHNSLLDAVPTGYIMEWVTDTILGHAVILVTVCQQRRDLDRETRLTIHHGRLSRREKWPHSYCSHLCSTTSHMA